MTTQIEVAQSPRRALNVSLWIVQGLLAAAFAMGGLMKVVTPMEELVASATWVGRFAPEMVRFIGLAELAGALGLILPAVARIRTGLVPLAAAGLTAVMVLAGIHHLMNAEAAMIAPNLVLGGLATFVAWGRFRTLPHRAR